MIKQKKWRWLLILLVVSMGAVIVFGTVSAFDFPPIEILKIFEDVNVLHPFATFIGWLKNNGIAGGYPDGTYRPNAYITRAEMAVMLKNTASTVVAAGAHVEHNGTEFVITEWFNNVNGQEPTHVWIFAHGIDFGFDMTDKFVQCTVDMDDSVSSFCSAKTGTTNVLAVVYDAESGNPLLEPHGFWLLVYGNDIQP